MSYAALKIIHVISVIFSYLLFMLRGIWMMQNSSILQRRWVKILPHVIDTVLLASAVTLVHHSAVWFADDMAEFDEKAKSVGVLAT
ncbi:MAG: SirB2 family protein, partial [Nitrosomonadaceae bacterium]|nr:SirB2 family protein [Nitrosomonadaceae bacterium]